jgi:predicted nuclease of restriction endonuclease-like RecB superfamily
VLTKDLLRVSRRGGSYRPRFTTREDRPLAARVLGVYESHVGSDRAALEAALTDLEREAESFKLVRGFAKLLERDATFETRSPLPPGRARHAAFAAAEEVGVASDGDRDRALARAGERLGVPAGAVERSLYADRDVRQVLAGFDPRWDADALLAQYDLSLAQTALFDATEVRVRSADVRRLVSAAKRAGLLYEVERTDAGRELVLTGPDALFRRTRRYGTAFARVLRTVAEAPEWSLVATVDDRGRERTLRLDQDDLSPPGVDPVAEPSYDSGVEADFAARFRALDLDWDLVREPEPLDAGDRLMVPDFAFDYRPAGADSARDRVFFEVMGFWTPGYVRKKLDQVDAVDERLVVAVDESLGVGDELAAAGGRVITYRDRVRVKDVVDVLREYEADLVAAADLPDELRPDADVTTIAEVAAAHGVAESAVEDRAFPEHERVGRTLLRPAVLDDLRAAVEPGMAFAAAETVLDEFGVDDASAVLSRLGYRVAWEGLTGGTVEWQDGRGERTE